MLYLIRSVEALTGVRSSCGGEGLGSRFFVATWRDRRTDLPLVAGTRLWLIVFTHLEVRSTLADKLGPGSVSATTEIFLLD